MATPTAIFLLCLFAIHQTTADIPSCSSPIYCQGEILDTVQRARIYNDSKTFVDLKLTSTVNQTLENFAFFKQNNPSPNKDQIQQFVDANFEQGNELEDWQPDDFNPNPKLLARIKDKKIKEFASKLVHLWKTLAKKVKPEVFENAEQYSLIPVENGFIIPGDRFREFYYWDSYWIIRGLIESDMLTTVKGMLENFIYLIQTIGFIPNGARVYYLNRSQPPLLSAMVHQYYLASKDKKFIEDNIEYLDEELTWWLENRVVEVTKNGRKYQVAHYDCESPSPRPESYREDIDTANFYTNEEQQKRIYCELISGAESGHDFSSRWFIDSKGGNSGNLTSIATSKIIPVDLNAILYQAFKYLSHFYLIIDGGIRKENVKRYHFWAEKALIWQKTIQEVHYSEKDGIWYDFNAETGQQREYFYASNFAPLWADVIDRNKLDRYGARAAAYLEKNNILEFPGGIPTSLIDSTEQWDFPNAWPPLQAFVVWGLHKTGNCDAVKLAKTLGKRWVQANLNGFQKYDNMYEKYSAVEFGMQGGGGEYGVQVGFGWTNGVCLDFIDLYYTVPDKKLKL